MSLLWPLLGALLLSAAGDIGQVESASVPTPSGCKRRCGNIDVPYPFGLDDDHESCYLLDDFGLTCNHSFNPPKLFGGDFEAVSLNISSGQLRALLNISYDCYSSSTGNDSDYSSWRISTFDHFLLSSENVFTVVGCDSTAKFEIGENNYCGCMSGCSSLAGAQDGKCNGIGCCQASVPQGVNSYNTTCYERDNSTSKAYKFNPCTYFFMVEKNNYTFHRSDLQYMDRNRLFPVIFDWFIGKRSCEAVSRNSSSYACVSSNSECVNSNNVPGYLCKCLQGYQGNPYLHDGCQDIDECQMDRTIYPCNGICTNTVGGYDCICPKGYQSQDPKRELCVREAKLSRKLLLPIGIGGGLLLLSSIAALVCLESQRRKIMSLREKHFKINGGIFLQELLSAHGSTFKIFSMTELRKATNKFSKANILGRGGFGVVYKGITENQTQIAVKKSSIVNEQNSKEFANELFILSKVNHINIVKLLGCCLQDEAPMLVYEFVRRGTLYDYIHGNEQSISYSTRIQIAAQVAAALKYLHIDAVPPVLHGDVKSANILLDDNLLVKVSDFGTSRLAPDEETKYTTMVKGTCGYLDPEYLKTGILTDKSDVFSFGVVLAELLTRKRPFILSADVDTKQILYADFVHYVKEKKVLEILDPQVVKEGQPEEITKLVNVAFNCLNVEGGKRPSIKKVALELGGMNADVMERLPSTLHDNIPRATRSYSGGPSTSSSSNYFTGPQESIFGVGLGR